MELSKATNAKANFVAGDDLDWSHRCDHWSELPIPKPKQTHSKNKRKRNGPLILCGNGVRLSVDKGTLLVRNGFTHYPQTKEELRFFPGDPAMPSRIIVLDGRGSLSFQVLNWLSIQNVPLVQVDWQGNVVTVAGSIGKGIDPKLFQAQRDAQSNGRALEIAQKLVADKIDNAIVTLRDHLPTAPATELAITKLERDQELMRNAPPDTSDKLRGVEGRVGNAYFGAWQSFPIRWKGTSKRPIPDEWRRIGWRRSHLSNSNQHAYHPVNAMLNYGYGILQNNVRMHLAGIGFDLSTGVLHGSYEHQEPLVYDMMEPLRPVADRVILDLVQENVFTSGDFVFTQTGVCRLNPELAKKVVLSIESNLSALPRALNLG